MNPIIKFTPNLRGDPAGQLATAEVYLNGPLAGLKLVGFAIWEGLKGARTVTFPARTYRINGERRTFPLLRAIVDMKSEQQCTELILAAYTQYETENLPA